MFRHKMPRHAALLMVYADAAAASRLLCCYAYAAMILRCHADATMSRALDAIDAMPR